LDAEKLPGRLAHRERRACHHFIGSQRRHECEYREAVGSYQRASDMVAKLSREARAKPWARWATIRTRVAAASTQTLQIDGDVKGAFDATHRARNDFEELLNETPAEDASHDVIGVHIAHTDRQVAHLQYLSGSYSDARDLYRSIATFYGYVHAEESAWAHAGEADCMLQLGSARTALAKLNVLLKLADRRSLRRLEIRVRRSLDWADQTLVASAAADPAFVAKRQSRWDRPLRAGRLPG